MRPVVNGLKQQYQDSLAIELIDFNSSDPANTSAVQKYNIPGHPSFIILNSKGEQVAHLEGAIPTTQLKAALKKAGLP